jgi:hypothetical protein
VSVLQPEETLLLCTRTHDDGGSRAIRSAPRLTRDQVRAVTDEDIGLKVLRNAPADADEIVEYVRSCSTQLHANFACSIVAVHGIGAHPDDSWCKNVGTSENAQWVNWLHEADMLPAVAPRARIMRYGYQSQWFGGGAMRQKASTVAQRLLLALRRRREVRVFSSTWMASIWLTWVGLSVPPTALHSALLRRVSRAEGEQA